MEMDHAQPMKDVVRYLCTERGEWLLANCPDLKVDMVYDIPLFMIRTVLHGTLDDCGHVEWNLRYGDNNDH